MKKLIGTILLTVAMLSSIAQKDTTKKTVVVTSAYKPVLKPAAKINFTAPSPLVDTTKPRLSYNIPTQNLFFTYQPGALKPLALSVDSVMHWTNDNYVKLGVGNYKTLLAEAGAAFGDGKTSLVNINGNFITQKGSLPFQQYSKGGISVGGMYSADGNNEWRGKLAYDNNKQYNYANADPLLFTKDSLLRRYSTFSGMFGLRNREVNNYGISYDPSLTFSLFGDNKSGRETNFILNAPFAKTFDESLSVKVAFTADITGYKTDSGASTKNNLYYLSPVVTIKRSAFTLNAGITPTWDNGDFHPLPNITAVIKVKDKPFVLQAGYVGFYQKNTYQSMATFNPFISQPDFLFNTRITESFFGLKGSAGSHLSYNGKLGVQSQRNALLFINDTLNGRAFMTRLEPKMNNLMIHGEIGYTAQEKFSLLAGVTVNRYSKLTSNTKAWGLLPLEMTGSLRWQVMKELQFKADAFIWDGASYFTKGDGSGRSKGAYDLNAGAEFTIIPKLNVWLQFNNILNNKYQRWYGYHVLGFNIAGGIVYSFSQP